MNVDLLICTTLFRYFYSIPSKEGGGGRGGDGEPARRVTNLHLHEYALHACAWHVYVHMHGMCMRLGAAFGA